MHNFIQTYWAIGDIYNEAHLDTEKMATYLARGKRQVAEKITKTRANTSKDNGVRINHFRDEIAKAM